MFAKIITGCVVVGVLISGYVLIASEVNKSGTQNEIGSETETETIATNSTQTLVGIENMLALIREGEPVVCEFSQRMGTASQTMTGMFYHQPDGRFRISATVTDGDIQYEADAFYDTTTMFMWSDNPEIMPDVRESYGAGEGISFYNVSLEQMDAISLLQPEAEYRCQARSFDTVLLNAPERFFAEYPDYEQSRRR